MLIPLNSMPERLIPPFSFVHTLGITEEILYESPEYYSVQNSRESSGCESIRKGALD